MKRQRLHIAAGMFFVVAAICWAAGLSLGEVPGQGTLTIIEPDGKPGRGCPLEHTSVKAEVSGFVSRVSVTQTFHNPREDKIEAVYTFPLPSDAAVDDMVMRVGERVVRGEIKRREEARRIYEEARDKGHVASLLDQERPNIFTQSVANIMPGQKVEITIKYVEMLPYDDGSFKFVFPMVVGPRFIPGQPVGKQGTGWAEDTTQVPDASKITPPVTPEGTRAGHDIDLTVTVDAGVPILGMESKLHEVAIARDGKNRATIALKDKKEIPNRDFVLSYLVADDRIRSGFLSHKEGKEGQVALILIPPKRVKPEQIAGKEMIFVIDRSGSQHGKPLQKAVETMKYVIDRMNPDDTFNVIDFGSTANMLFSEPKKNTPEYRGKALRYIESLNANGGTWMGPAVELVCKTPPPENRLRIVTFMTDGYVGNDFEIISLVQKLRGKSRWFPFGTGNSVNRFLLDQMARVGGGEVDYVLLNSSAEEVGKKFYQRIATPVLTDISLSLDGLSLEERFPEAVADLWDRKPLIFKARYTSPGKGTVTIKGFSGGKPYEQRLEVTLPDKEAANSSLGPLWARAKVDDLMGRDWMGMQRGNPKSDIKEEIVRVALEHRIMTQFTSFVAVEETVVTIGGKPTRVAVPVEMPDGVSRERIFGDAAAVAAPQGALQFHGLPAGRVAAKRARSLEMPATAPMTRQAVLGSPLKEETEPASVADKLQAPGEKDSPAVLVEREERKVAALERKLSPDLAALVALKEKPKDYAAGKVIVKDGKTTVQVWVAKTTDEVLKKLKAAGLEVSFTASTGKMVIGLIAVDKLEELAKIPDVRLIEPVAAG
ncbi:MAG: VWA domain-containing protein [Desulfomonile tiedjei]|nr:VWA domain-containing protein [Desulfomonile tiedjei]